MKPLIIIASAVAAFGVIAFLLRRNGGGPTGPGPTGGRPLSDASDGERDTVRDHRDG